MQPTHADRAHGWALIGGALAGLATMAFHPTAASAPHNPWVHALALCTVPVTVFGALGLTRRLAAGAGWLAELAFVCFGFANAAVVGAAVASGFVAPALDARARAADAALRPGLEAALVLDHCVNQALARV